jgi:hypothetical protein
LLHSGNPWTLCKQRAGAKKELLQFDGSLGDVDPEIASIIANEKKRQARRGFAGLS